MQGERAERKRDLIDPDDYRHVQFTAWPVSGSTNRSNVEHEFERNPPSETFNEMSALAKTDHTDLLRKTGNFGLRAD